ncbi:MAG TPA: glycosyltransferase family 39 protein [Candidatus Aquicultor sp.]|jgi:uncharacterized membrane protein
MKVLLHTKRSADSTDLLSWQSHIALLATLLMGTIARIYHLSTASLWFDEAFSVRVSSMSFTNMLQEIIRTDFNPPLHFIILHYWMKLFGNSEASIRCLSAIFGIAAVYMMYRLGKYLFNKEIGIMSALLLALSRPNIYFSQEARGYSLMLFLTLMSFYFLFRLIDKRTTSSSVLYLLSSALLLYTHMFGVLIVVTQTVYLVFKAVLYDLKHDRRFIQWLVRAWPIYQMILLVAYAPWVMVYIHKLTEARSMAQQPLGWTLEQPSLAMLSTISTKLAGSSWLLIAIIACIVLAALSMGLGRLSPSHRYSILTGRFISNGLDSAWVDNERLLLLLMWFLAPILLAAVVSITFVPIIHYKYLLGITPALYLLTAVGTQSVKPVAAKTAIVVIIVALSLVNIWGYYTTPTKPDWRSVVASIERRAAAGELVVVSPAPNIENGFSYYLKRTDLVVAPFPKQGMLSDTQRTDELRAVVKSNRDFWVVVLIAHGENGLIGNRMALTQILKSNYHIADRTDFDGIELYHCQQR